jgi:hypothetical protein
MARLSQIRGLILEEVILYLLRVNGYVTVEDPGNDATLLRGAAGIEVRGRGCLHQIDAIADYSFSPPFSNPQRLLVEAKSLSQRVGVDVIRNAVGVLKDVSEFWVGSGESRRHYQYAVFADTEFSKRAQEYSVAHDVYLFPLSEARFMRPVLQRMRQLTAGTFGANDADSVPLNLTTFRADLRRALRGEFQFQLPAVLALVNETRTIRHALIAVALKQLPIFLVPAPGVDIDALPDRFRVRIRWDDNSWYLDDANDRRLFSFDLPEVLFQKFASEGVLTRQAALNLKEAALSDLQATVFSEGHARIIQFELDVNWVATVRERINTRRPERRD